MDRLAELRRTTLLRKYHYVRSELEETQCRFEEYNRLFVEEFRAELDASMAARAPPPPEAEDEDEQAEDGDGDTEQCLPEVRRLYRKLALAVHPDKGGDPAAFREVQQALHDNDPVALLLLAQRLGVDAGVQLSDEALAAGIEAVTALRDDHFNRLAWLWGAGVSAAGVAPDGEGYTHLGTGARSVQELRSLIAAKIAGH